MAKTFKRLELTRQELAAQEHALGEDVIVILTDAQTGDAPFAFGTPQGQPMVRVHSTVSVAAVITASGLPSYHPVVSQAAMLALSAKRGDWAVRSDLTTDPRFLLTGDDPTVLANWVRFTDDFTAAEKSNLDTASTHAGSAHAPAAAEQNVQPDWNQATTGADDFIKNKPTSMTPTAHNTSHATGGTDVLTLANIGAEATANKGVAGGYCDLDLNIRVPLARLPILSTLASTSIAPILGANVGIPGYRRCKLIPVNSTTTGSGDYQVELKIGESITASGADFHLGGNSQGFPSAQKLGGELKFVLPDGTDIPFFVAEVTGTTPNRVATVFLRLSGITGQASSVQRLVFLLYDNNLFGVTSQMSAIASVFNLLADDFDAASLDPMWDGTVITGQTFASSVISFGGGNVGRKLASVATFGDSIEMLARLRMSDTAASYVAFGWDSATVANIFKYQNGWDSAARINASGVFTNLTNDINNGAGVRQFARIGRSGGAGRFISTNPANTANIASGVPTVGGVLTAYNTYDNSTEIDWVAVRQYLASPPTIGTIQDV